MCCDIPWLSEECRHGLTFGQPARALLRVGQHGVGGDAQGLVQGRGEVVRPHREILHRPRDRVGPAVNLATDRRILALTLVG